MTAAIVTRDLTKHYGRKLGCENVCLSVPSGHIFGFLGKNGAGKSTTVKMLVGLIAPTSGEGELLGRPIGDFAVRERVGFLPENFKYQDWLTPRELLAFHGRLRGMESVEIADEAPRVLADVGLAAEAGNKIRSFSKGMQQRLGLACALLGRPDVLFLDEPTSALDPIGRHDVRELLVRERERGAAVFLNSHLLSEIEMVCDDVAFLKSGRIVESGPLGSLLRAGCQVEVGLAAPFTPDAALLDGSLDARLLESETARLVVALPAEDAVPILVERLVGAGARILSVTRRQRSLEALFLETLSEEGAANA